MQNTIAGTKNPIKKLDRLIAFTSPVTEYDLILALINILEAKYPETIPITAPSRESIAVTALLSIV